MGQLTYTTQEVQDILDGVGTYVRPNLLDNWFFGNPVNQRGASSYSTSYGYTIDRWLQARLTSTIVSGGLSISWDGATGSDGYIMFRGENGSSLAGKEVTASILADGELYSVTGTFPSKGGSIINTGFTLNNNTMRIIVEWGSANDWWDVAIATNTTAAAVVQAVKLELGSTQTLAHQDSDGNWVLNEIPNYAEQLARCQRYYYRLVPNGGGYMSVGNGVATSPTRVLVPVTFPVTMRTNPAMTASSTAAANTRCRGSATITPTSYSVDIANKQGSLLRVDGSGYTTGNSYNVYMTGAGSDYLEFSADL